MVHNAASFLGGKLERYSEESLDEVLSVNLKACFRLSAACILHFRKRGGGRLLFTSSVTGPRVAIPQNSPYAASKGGVNAFIRAAAWTTVASSWPIASGNGRVRSASARVSAVTSPSVARCRAT